MEYRGFLNLSVLGDLIAVPIVITHKKLNIGAEVVIKIEYKFLNICISISVNFSKSSDYRFLSVSKGCRPQKGP